MRRWNGLLAAALCLALTACGAGRPPVDAESSVFRTLEVSGADGVTAEVYLSETEAAFLAVELAEAAEATLHYTYATEDRSGVRLRVTPPEGEAAVCDLTAAAEEAYDALWTDETVFLQAGTTVFSLTGEDVTCRMRLEVNGLEPETVLSVEMG